MNFDSILIKFLNVILYTKGSLEQWYQGSPHLVKTRRLDSSFRGLKGKTRKILEDLGRASG